MRKMAEFLPFYTTSHLKHLCISQYIKNERDCHHTIFCKPSMLSQLWEHLIQSHLSHIIKFLRFLFSHTLYILFFVGIGTNSSFNCIPNPCASFFTILRLGFLVPFSIRLISACVIPVLADKSFCVIFCCTLASIIAWIISYSGYNASYSAFTSGFCNALFYNLYSYSLPYLRS